MTRFPSPLRVDSLPAPLRTCTLAPETWTVGLPPTPEATTLVYFRSALSSSCSGSETGDGLFFSYLPSCAPLTLAQPLSFPPPVYTCFVLPPMTFDSFV